MTTLYDFNGNEIVVSGTAEIAEPAYDDLPCIYWTGLNGASSPSSKDDGEIQGRLKYASNTETFAEYATIKVQGNTSTNYPKKNFTLKTFSDSEFTKKSKHEFKNWGKMSKWVLKAHWAESSHLRNVGLARIWGQIVRSRSDYESLPTELKESPNQGATDGFHVKMFINGEYWGIYELIIPKDKLFGQDSDNVNHSILNSGSQYPSVWFRSTAVVGWEEELQDAMSTSIDSSWGNVLSMVMNGGFAYNNGKLDISSVIDWDIFARVFLLSDSLDLNQIFFTYDGTKWYEGAWDLDATMGNSYNGHITYEYNTAFQDGYLIIASHGHQSNLLYDTIESLFTSQLKARYAELRSSVLSEENILDVFEKLYTPIQHLDGLYAEDTATTTGGGAFVNMPGKADNNIQQIRSFMKARLAYMDGVIEAM